MSDQHLDEDDALLGRLAGGLQGIAPRSDAGTVIGRALARRKRRRAATAAVGVAALVVVAGVASTLVVHGMGDDEPGPAASSSVRDAYHDGQFAPAGFFSDVVGGTANPLELVHHGPGHRAHGELFYSPVRWRPDETSPQSYLIDIAAERVRGSRAAACRRLTMGAAGACEVLSDGDAMVIYDVPASEAFYDPVHRLARFENPHPGVRVHGITYLQAGGLAISVWSCNCASVGGRVTEAAPLTDDELVAVAGDESWKQD